MDNGLLTIATCHCDVKRSNGTLGWGCSREETAAVAIKRWATAAVRKRPVTNTGSLHSTRALELSLSLSTDSLSLSLQHWEINWLRNRPGRSTTENGPIDRVERRRRCRSEAIARRIGSEQQQLEITSGEYVVAG